jgi:hypothetical protein
MATSAAITNLATLVGAAKEVYAKLLEDIRVEETYFQENVKLDKQNLEGNFYHQPVALTQNCGQFFDVPDGSADMTNFPPVSMQTGDAQLKGYQLADRLRITYEALSRLANGEKASFINENGLKMLSLWKSARRNLELSILYGSIGLGRVNVIGTITNGGTANAQAPLTMDPNEWAPGMWIAAENKTLQFVGPAFGTVTYSGSSGAQTVVIGGVTASFTAGASDALTAQAALAAVQAVLGISVQCYSQINTATPTVLSLYSKDPNALGSVTTLTVTGTGATASGATFTVGAGVRGASAGKSVQVVSTIDDLSVPTLTVKNFNGVTDVVNAITIGDVVFRSPEFGASPLGIQYWLLATARGGIPGAAAGSNVVANISSTDYSAWRSSLVDLQGKQLNFQRLFDAVSKAQDRGLDGRVVVAVGPKLYALLLSEAENTVNKDYSYKSSEFEGGFKGITVTSYTGEMELVPHRFVKRAQCYILPMDELVRIGSVDLVEKIGDDAEVSLQLDAPNGLYRELRLFTNQNFLIRAPAKCVMMINIGFPA